MGSGKFDYWNSTGRFTPEPPQADESEGKVWPDVPLKTKLQPLETNSLEEHLKELPKNESVLLPRPEKLKVATQSESFEGTKIS